MAEPVRFDVARRGVVFATLDRPERRNALSIALLEALVAGLDRLAGDGTTRVVILRGAGPVFCAGLDLAEAADEALVERSALGVSRALERLGADDLVTIAAVHGGAYAGGVGLASACDLVIAASDTRFGFPEARRGLLPALVCDVLKTKVRRGDLTELFLVGEPIDAPRARDIGLVQRVVPAVRLEAPKPAVAEAILAGGPETIRRTKTLIRHAFGWPPGDPAAAAAAVAEHLVGRRSAEATEGLRAFLEKRAPSWTPSR